MEYYLERSDGQRIPIKANTGHRLLAINADGEPVLDPDILDPETGKIRDDLFPEVVLPAPAPADANYRVKNGDTLQLRETAPTPGWRTVWFEDGQPKAGELDES